MSDSFHDDAGERVRGSIRKKHKTETNRVMAQEHNWAGEIGKSR
jgi:hypothetical protein